MNRWECDRAECLVTADGIGGAIGLRAIGWFFDIGPMIYCPRHHPYGADVAQRVADVTQRIIEHATTPNHLAQ